MEILNTPKQRVSGKSLLLFLGLTLALITIQPVHATTLYSDDFELGNGNWSNTSSGDNKNWSRDSGGTTSSGTGPQTGSGGSNFYMYLETSFSGAYSSGDSAILLSPAISGSDIRLAFDYHMFGRDIGTLAVDVLSNGIWVNDVWSLSGQQQSSNGATYSRKEVDLAAYVVSQLRFRATAAGSYRGDIAIDNIAITSIPSGPSAPVFNENPLIKPNATQGVAYQASVASDAVDANGDALSFTKVTGPSWLVVAPDGALSGTPSASDVGANQFELGVSDGNLESTAMLNINVRDGSIILSDNFESGFGNWSNIDGVDNENWTRDTNGTPSGGTGPSRGALNSAYYLYLETSSSGAFNNGDSAILQSPIFTAASTELSFSYHMYGANIGILLVDVFSNNTWIKGVWSVSGQQHRSSSADYTEAKVDLSAYQVSQIRLRAIAEGDFRGDIAIDNIELIKINNSSADNDADGVENSVDLCPDTALAESVDDNGCSAAQRDSDSDGFADSIDAFPLDSSEWLDTDSDFVGNNTDDDDDNDGVLDINDAFPLDSSESLDTDNDGIGNNADNDDDGDSVADANDAFPLDNSETLDTDNDGLGNNADTDDDGDSVPDTEDAFPLDPSEWADSDADGIGDNSDPFPNDPNTLNTTYLHGEILYEFSGASSSDQLGSSVGAHGDVNNDGIEDFVVGAPQPINGGIGGYAQVYSGADGAVLFSFTGSYNRQKLGTSVALLRDVNADGHDEVLIGAPGECSSSGNTDSGSARLYSGLDGSLLYTFLGTAIDDCFGYSVAAAGDIDLDGIDDLLVGAKNGYVQAFSGVDGTTIYTLQASLTNEAIGTSVSSAGDVNGDGTVDILSAASDFNYAEVFSGADGSSLYAMADNGDTRIGVGLSAVGDINHDGYDDFAIGRIWHNTPTTKSGLVTVYSGQDGSQIWAKSGNGSFQTFGASIDMADMNADGEPDIVVGTLGSIVNGRVEVLTGSTGTRISNNKMGANNNGFGGALATVGDLNGDGVAEIVVGAKLDSSANSGAGKVFVLASQLDSDGDGVADASDSSPFDPNIN